MKEAIYNYTNQLGIKKAIIIKEMDNGEYEFSLWDMKEEKPNEFCGGGIATKDKLQKFLSNYGLVFGGE